ncbi:MAG: M14 family metallopeptidase [Nitriliruptor sp.]|uniref:M14 family metallopeptidase n=1 Tax=Nitriliruptor sp. TaxID=2448056 RepID=UPI0034A024EA
MRKLRRTACVASLGLLAAVTLSLTPGADLLEIEQARSLVAGDAGATGAGAIDPAQLVGEVVDGAAPVASGVGGAIEDAFAPQLVTVTTPTRADKDRLVALGLDLTEHAGHDYIEVVLHTVADAALLTANGFDYDVRIPDLIARGAERQQLDATFAAANPITQLPSGRNSYRVLDDFGAEIDQLVAANRDTAKRISIGESVEGRDLTGIEIGREVNAPEDGRPVFLMFGAHHAREWPSAELPMEFAHDLLGSDGTDARITDLLDRSRVIIVPVSNPDGFDASRTSGELVDLRELDRGGTVSILGTPGNAYKRKNCRVADGFSQPAGACIAFPSPGGNGIGVDLNRNYGALWGGPGADAEPHSAIYRGPEPFSEPETQAIRELISSRQVTTLISNHTFSNLILRPVGVQPTTIAPDGYPVGYSPDEHGPKGMAAVGDHMAAANGYSSQFGWELYDTTGTTEDYSYNATGGYGYTFEIGAHEFHPPYEEVVAEYTGDNDAAHGAAHGGGNREAFLRAFENVVDEDTHSVITGTGPEGADLTVTREGTFPLWDGTQVADTVSTSMAVGAGDRFDWHVNPSTRPFVQSRAATVLSDPIESISETGVTPPLLQVSEVPLTLTQPADLIRAQVTNAAPVPTPGLNTRQFGLTLRDPSGATVASAAEFGPSNTLVWTGPDDAGITPGDYTLVIANSLGLGAWELEAGSYDVAGDSTPRLYEDWVLTCAVDGEVVGQRTVFVERGERVDVGEVCGRTVTDPGDGDGSDRPGKGKGVPGKPDGTPGKGPKPRL